MKSRDDVQNCAVVMKCDIVNNSDVVQIVCCCQDLKNVILGTDVILCRIVNEMKRYIKSLGVDVLLFALCR